MLLSITDAQCIVSNLFDFLRIISISFRIFFSLSRYCRIFTGVSFTFAIDIENRMVSSLLFSAYHSDMGISRILFEQIAFLREGNVMICKPTIPDSNLSNHNSNKYHQLNIHAKTDISLLFEYKYQLDKNNTKIPHESTSKRSRPRNTINPH